MTSIGFCSCYYETKKSDGKFPRSAVLRSRFTACSWIKDSQIAREEYEIIGGMRYDLKKRTQIHIITTGFTKKVRFGGYCHYENSVVMFKKCLDIHNLSSQVDLKSKHILKHLKIHKTFFVSKAKYYRNLLKFINLKL